MLMERARAQRSIALPASEPDVADLRMQRSVQRSPFDYQAAADAGADGDVRKTAYSLACAALPLGARRRVDIGVDVDGHPETGRKPGPEIRAAPTGLGGIQHEPVIRRER